jgi:hypothetical protein
MMDMLLDCAIFCPAQGDSNNYYQLSGPPISELNPIRTSDSLPADAVPIAVATHPSPPRPNVNKTPCAVVFIRSRILYAKPAVDAKGNVKFGMRHIRLSLPRRLQHPDN